MFGQQFLNFIILVGGLKIAQKLSSSLVQYIVSLGATRVEFMHHDLAEGIEMLDGLYIASALGLHPVWKLLPDSQGAFAGSVMQTRSGE